MIRSKRRGPDSSLVLEFNLKDGCFAPSYPARFNFGIPPVATTGDPQPIPYDQGDEALGELIRRRGSHLPKVPLLASLDVFRVFVGSIDSEANISFTPKN